MKRYLVTGSDIDGDLYIWLLTQKQWEDWPDDLDVAMYVGRRSDILEVDTLVSVINEVKNGKLRPLVATYTDCCTDA